MADRKRDRDDGSLRIRRGRPADAAALAALRYEFRAARRSATRSRAAFVRRCTAWMRRSLTDKRWRCWIATTDHEIAGHVWIQLVRKIPNPGAEPECLAYLTNLYVRPAARGGAGTRLLLTAVEWCRSHEIDSIILWPSPRSRSLYERHGFALSGHVLHRSLRGAARSSPRRRRRS